MDQQGYNFLWNAALFACGLVVSLMFACVELLFLKGSILHMSLSNK